MPGWEATFPHHTGKSKLFLDIVSVISTMTTRCPWAGAVKTIKLFAALQKEDLKTKLHKKLKICDFGGFEQVFTLCSALEQGTAPAACFNQSVLCC